jgi:thiol-disulfide isomerase/thioredoxin
MRLITILLALSAFALSAQNGLVPVDQTGYQKLLSDNKGKVVLIDFWATYCKPCRAETPKLVALASKLRARGFQFITVSADEPEQAASAAKFVNEMHVPGTAYIRQAKDDEKFINFIDAKWSGAMPALFLYDKAGHKVKSFIGEHPIDAIEAAVIKLL